MLVRQPETAEPTLAGGNVAGSTHAHATVADVSTPSAQEYWRVPPVRINIELHATEQVDPDGMEEPTPHPPTMPETTPGPKNIGITHGPEIDASRVSHVIPGASRGVLFGQKMREEKRSCALPGIGAGVGGGGIVGSAVDGLGVGGRVEGLVGARVGVSVGDLVGNVNGVGVVGSRVGGYEKGAGVGEFVTQSACGKIRSRQGGSGC